MFERSTKSQWELVLGMLAVACVLLALPLAAPDLSKLVKLPESLFHTFAVAGVGLAVIGLAGVAVLVIRAMFRRPTTWCEFRPVSKRDVQAVFELMKGFFGDETPSTTRMLEWQRRNKKVLTAVYAKEIRGRKTTQTLVGLFKILPLTSQAAELFEREERTGATVSPDHIAAEGQEIAALYIGDVLALTRAAKADVLRQLKASVERQLKAGLTVYTRPLTTDGARLVRKYNFVPVMQDLPSGSIGRIHKLIITGSHVSGHVE